jgi:hypothetical protein
MDDRYNDDKQGDFIREYYNALPLQTNFEYGYRGPIRPGYSSFGIYSDEFLDLMGFLFYTPEDPLEEERRRQAEEDRRIDQEELSGGPGGGGAEGAE